MNKYTELSWEKLSPLELFWEESNLFGGQASSSHKMYQLNSEFLITRCSGSLSWPSLPGWMGCPSSVFWQCPGQTLSIALKLLFFRSLVFYLLFPLNGELLKNPGIVSICMAVSFQGTLIRVSKAGTPSHHSWVVLHFQVSHRPSGSFPDYVIRRLASYLNSAARPGGQSDCNMIVNSTAIWAGLPNECLIQNCSLE